MHLMCTGVELEQMVQKQKSVIDYCKTTDMTCFAVQLHLCMQPTSLADISTNMLVCVRERRSNEICR